MTNVVKLIEQARQPYAPQPSREHLRGVRVPDLIAKVAKVTLKDTVRVLMALDTVTEFLDEQTDDLLSMAMSISKPNGGEASQCNAAYAELREFLIRNGEPDWLDTIKGID